MLLLLLLLLLLFMPLSIYDFLGALRGLASSGAHGDVSSPVQSVVVGKPQS
jgi:hypothetical protein